MREKSKKTSIKRIEKSKDKKVVCSDKRKI